MQLPGTLITVPAALLKVEKRPDGTFVGCFRYGDRYLERKHAIAFDPFRLPLGDTVHEFTRLKGIPGAVRDAGPDAWGRRVIATSSQLRSIGAPLPCSPDIRCRIFLPGTSPLSGSRPCR